MSADVAVGYLRDLAETREAADGGPGRRMLAEALFERIDALGFRETTLRLSDIAIAHGFAAVIPDRLEVSVGNGRGERARASLTQQSLRFLMINRTPRESLPASGGTKRMSAHPGHGRAAVAVRPHRAAIAGRQRGGEQPSGKLRPLQLGARRRLPRRRRRAAIQRQERQAPHLTSQWVSLGPARGWLDIATIQTRGSRPGGSRSVAGGDFYVATSGDFLMDPTGRAAG